jgi:hypothetical protein
MEKLANEYGVSDVALAKTCRNSTFQSQVEGIGLRRRPTNP